MLVSLSLFRTLCIHSYVFFLLFCPPFDLGTDFTSSDAESYHGPGGSLEICRLRISGDSFLMHQIRNMIGLSVAVCRGLFEPEVIPATLAVPARTPTILGKRNGQAERDSRIHTYKYVCNLSLLFVLTQALCLCFEQLHQKAYCSIGLISLDR